MFPPSRAPLFEWVRRGHLAPQHLAQAERLLGLPPSKAQWQQLLDRLLLLLGTLCLAAGLIFFIAFNWHQLGRLSRLLLVTAPLLAVLLLGLRPLTPPQRQALLLFAGLNLGGLLALIGQTYQTGADPWQLFALWAALLLPWALLGRSAVLWGLAWMLGQLALVLYWPLGIESLFAFDEETLAWCLTLGNALLWGVLLALPRHLRPPLPTYLPALAAGLGATLLVLLNLFELTSPLAWVAWLGWLGAGYRLWHGSFLTGLALGALSVICVILVAVGKWVDIDMNGFLLLALLAITLSVLAVRWLKLGGGAHE
ncbi:DUF2157 domain-containing protein [Aeromonas simiae]|uniref:DUF2157 domain-containing protein n=1 Tax=Aeromonas simiae TaxID=218936 RepID=UPI0038D243D7